MLPGLLSGWPRRMAAGPSSTPTVWQQSSALLNGPLLCRLATVALTDHLLHQRVSPERYRAYARKLELEVLATPGSRLPKMLLMHTMPCLCRAALDSSLRKIAECRSLQRLPGQTSAGLKAGPSLCMPVHQLSAWGQRIKM